MRVLQLHCDRIEYTPTKKEIKSAEEIEPKKTILEEVVVCFIAVEKDDDLEIANYQSNISSKASLILFFTMLAITMFVFYPSLIINIGSNISIDFFNN